VVVLCTSHFSSMASTNRGVGTHRAGDDPRAEVLVDRRQLSLVLVKRVSQPNRLWRPGIASVPHCIDSAVRGSLAVSITTNGPATESRPGSQPGCWFENPASTRQGRAQTKMRALPQTFLSTPRLPLRRPMRMLTFSMRTRRTGRLRTLAGLAPSTISRSRR
jgi:hypothetical protein